MGSVSKLTSIAISLTILALFVTAVLVPIISANLIPGDIYKTDDSGYPLDKDGNIASTTGEPPVIIQEAPNISGRTTINAIITLFPVFIGIGGLLIIIRAFHKR